MPDLSTCWCNTDPDLPIVLRYQCDYHREQLFRANFGEAAISELEN